MRTTTTTACLALLLLASPAFAQSDLSEAEAVRLAKAAEAKRVALIAKVSKAFVAIGGGSGIVISPDGYILTNHHVAGSRAIGKSWVVIRPGTEFGNAKMIATDPRGDISLLKLEGKKGPYPYVPLGDSDKVKTGDQVIALGNPFGFSKDGTPHVTVGVISAVHRFQGGYSDAIQTDTPINPGNSGGPLIDMQGHLLGINGRIAVRFGTRNNTGVGYAIPVNQIKEFLPIFKEGGIVGHATARGMTLTETPEGGDGALVRSIRSSSSAYQSGLREGDLVVEAGGRAVRNPRRFHGIVGTYPANAQIDVTVKRAGALRRFKLALEARNQRLARLTNPHANPHANPHSTPRTTPRASGGAYLGVSLSTAEEGGVEVEAVRTNSPAESAGLQTGDVIKKIDGKPVKDLTALVGIMGGLRPGQTIKVAVERDDKLHELDVKLGRRPPGNQ